MAHEDDRSLVALQGEKQGSLCLRVQVVRRLIEQQHVVSADNDSCEREFRSLTTRESPCFLIDLVREEKEPQDGAQFAVGKPRDLPHVVQNGCCGMDVLVLLCVVADRYTVSDLDFAKIGCLHTGQDPQKRRLSCPVEPHDHQPVPSVDDHVDIHEYDVQSICLGKIGSPDGDLA